ncbi:MAG TPA: AsnC family transcriptional regulator [Clostridiales bacterium]|jgi:DNA-binding Lrp family transcriptional regulator|nr:Lrp/AsnC family transcriptional regulator [Clostridiales bacterium]MBD8946258.1 Lrp/AsnC family transcriptional regulator [Clostridiales bacterium]HBL82314.1 AsnC family transcriptional regulator [Clostridiales bacterium]
MIGDKERILKLIERDVHANPEEIAVMIGKDKAYVQEILDECVQNQTILGQKTIIDWEKTERELVSAIIELKVTPQRGSGFDRISERIYQYDEISSVYLVSGGFDIAVIVEGKTVKEVALFVAEKLAPMDEVISTATHFILKKYKAEGVILNNKMEDDREVITL